MRPKSFSFLSLVLAGFLIAACRDVSSLDSDIKVTNGRQEYGYAYVVPISLDRAGLCTGSFVSDSLLITAAHCVDRISTVTYNGVSVGRSDIFVNPQWRAVGTNGCQSIATDARFDTAMVRFPKGTFKGGTYATLLGRSPRAGEELTIVGYGNNRISPFERYCRVSPSVESDGACHVMSGTLTRSGDFGYQSVLTFNPEADADSCSPRCTSSGLKASLAMQAIPVSDFLAEHCGGNFRDRSYQETGAGEKRSGRNRIKGVSDGLVAFDGSMGGLTSSVDSASGSGDSGGPLFIEVDGRAYLAATTHGGFLVKDGASFRKRSYYVDLASDHSLPWFEETVRRQDLDFPQLN